MREKLRMNRDWLFYFGEPDYRQPKYTSSDQQYRGSRAENARGPARRDFYDRDWRLVQLPHDFVAENGLADSEPFGGEHYDFPRDRGSAWYRRYFRLEETDRDKRIVLHFEAVATKCEVYVNSMLLKTNRTAGIGFDVDITEVARFGTDYNVISVHVDCHDYEAWYYEGGGITRNVWLQKTDKVCVALWGVFANPIRLQDEQWELKLETEIENHYDVEKEVYIVSNILNPDGETIAKIVSDKEIVDAECTVKYQQVVEVNKPMLWDIGACNMYRVVTEVVIGDQVVDLYETKFGFREILFDKDKGFFLNGRRVTIYGFANHMTYLGVGEAMSDSMREFQMRTLAEMGSNGFRTAHSPHGEATYDYCDQYGMLVMDENRIFHSSEMGIDEVERMVKRDRNHPSVIMWSLYNEEDTMTHDVGRRIFKKLYTRVRRLDDSRPITGATSYGIFTEHAHDDHDLIGINHETAYFDNIHQFKPDKPIFCSEMIYPVGVRGTNGEMGLDAKVCEKDYMIGGYHFTGWRFGHEKAFVFDGLGTPGLGYYGFKAYFKPDEPLVKIYPAWNHPGKEGQKVMMNIPNNGEYAQIYVNGKMVAQLDTDLYASTPCEVVYEPGECRVVVYKNGNVWAEDCSCTPTEPVALKLVMENPELKADDDDVAIITCSLVDADGRLCNMESGQLVSFEINKAGEFITSLSTREDGLQGYRGKEIRLEDGKCQILVRSLCTDEDLVVSAFSKNMAADKIVITRKPQTQENMPAVESNYILDWTISELYPYSIDEQKIMKEHRIERWEHIDIQGSPDILYGKVPDAWSGKPGVYTADTIMNYALHNYAKVPDMGDPEGLQLGLHFEGIDGVADIYVTNGELTYYAHQPENAPWAGHYRPEIKMLCEGFKPNEEVEIWVFIRNAGRVNGIGWPVKWIYTTQKDVEELKAKTKREWSAARENITKGV